MNSRPTDSAGSIRFRVEETEVGRRLDVAVASHLEDVSRAQIQKWIRDGRVRLDEAVVRASHHCREGEWIAVELPPLKPAEPEPEDLPLDILFEDEDLVVVNKAAGLTVHPAPGHETGTLVNALLFHCRDLRGIGSVLRPGIVHRLDRGTSGVIVVAKRDRSHRSLSAQFQERRVTKRYLAVVHGRPPDELRLDSPIGRDPIHRTKISSRAPRAKSALSLAQTLERLPGSTLLSVRIETGRTHQIRVHLSEAGYPLVGDRDYGGGRARGRLPVTVSGLLQGFPRPALHASRLGFIHPTSGERVEIEAPLPADLESLLSQLRTLGKSP